jgi:hypothetical protein
MGSFADLRGDVEVAAPSGSVSALVLQMQTELYSLMTRREELVRRIRNLHQVVRGLRVITNPPVFDYGRMEPPPSSAALRDVTAPTPDDLTLASPSVRHLQYGVRCKSNRVSTSLQRACRIALMEAETAASVDEICARIVRRGSFSFANMECASSALMPVLNAMAEDGEVRLLEGGPRPLWERFAKPKEA